MSNECHLTDEPLEQGGSGLVEDDFRHMVQSAIDNIGTDSGRFLLELVALYINHGTEHLPVLVPQTLVHRRVIEDIIPVLHLALEPIPDIHYQILDVFNPSYPVFRLRSYLTGVLGEERLTGPSVLYIYKVICDICLRIAQEPDTTIPTKLSNILAIIKNTDRFQIEKEIPPFLEKHNGLEALGGVCVKITKRIQAKKDSPFLRTYGALIFVSCVAIGMYLWKR